MEPVLVTERLALRRFTAGDAGELLAVYGDPAVMRFLDSQTLSREQIETRVLPRFLGYYQRYEHFGHWAASTRPGGDFIGWFGLRPVLPGQGPIEHWPDGPEAGVAALGYRLRRSAWGRGYATEGARALVRWAFTELGVTEIVATTMAVNTRSRAVLEKTGLGHTRTVHLDWPDPLPGSERGEAEYRLRAAEWAAR